VLDDAVIWHRIDFFSDGTLSLYAPKKASSRGWDAAPLQRGKWTIGSGKYSDTGEHFFKVLTAWVANDDYNVGDPDKRGVMVITDDGQLRGVYSGSDRSVFYSRGDHFPY
jgi:hypothetical protein